MHRILWVMLVGAAGVAATLSMVQPPSPRAYARAILAYDLQTDYLLEVVESVLPQLVAETRFEDNWAINEPHEPGRLNVYVVLGPAVRHTPDAPSFLSRVARNCAYLGDDVITLDAWYLESFLSQRRLVGLPLPFAHDGRQPHLRSFILWVLGHEIGHAVSGHREGHFSPEGLERHVGVSAASHRAEFQADEFVVTVLARSPETEHEVVRLLSDIMWAEIVHSKTGMYPAPTDISTGSMQFGGEIEYTIGGTHPDFVLRIARLAQLISEFDRPGNSILGLEVAQTLRSLQQR